MGVVVLHMCFLFILLVVNSVWYSLPYPIVVEQVETMMYVYISVATLTSIVELRVRKVEFQSALMALLDAKKSYVRYISHGKSAVGRVAVSWQSVDSQLTAVGVWSVCGRSDLLAVRLIVDRQCFQSVIVIVTTASRCDLPSPPLTLLPSHSPPSSFPPSSLPSPSPPPLPPSLTPLLPPSPQSCAPL